MGLRKGSLRYINGQSSLIYLWQYLCLLACLVHRGVLGCFFPGKMCIKIVMRKIEALERAVSSEPYPKHACL